VAKARTAKRGPVQHTWTVTRRNNQSITVSAETLSVVDGELVFSTDGLVVKIVAADTYSEVDLIENR
jgi:hypothetical protein